MRVVVVSNEHALGALIDQAKKANGWSDQTVADRAASRGHNISKSNIARIRTEPVTTIVGKQLFALEAGLGIPVRQLARAALDSMGVPGYTTAEADAEQAIAADPALPEHVRRTLLTIIRTERVARKDSIHDTELQTPTESRTSGKAEREDEEAKVYTLKQGNQGERVDDPEPDFSMPGAAYTPKLGEKGSKEAREQDELADRPDPEGPEGGA